MSNQVNPPRGMRDFLPGDKQRREQVLAIIRQSYSAHGFQEIEAPALEDLGRLTSGQGGDNEKLVFRVLKRGEELDYAVASGGELADLGLRYDLTVPLTRYFASNHSKLPKVFKSMQIGPVWRAERPQKGRYRQFLQCDIDIIGDASLGAEAELLVASLDALERLDLGDAKVRVNHRDLLIGAVTEWGVPQEEQTSVLITLDKLDKIGHSGVEQELTERLGSQIAGRFTEWWKTRRTDQVPDKLQQLFTDVQSVFPNHLVFDPALVRGMGYYTGAIFEIQHPAVDGSIGGGGRYDGMVGRWLGMDTPAVGISIGFERVIDLVALPKSDAPGVVIVHEPGEFAQALRVQREAIREGWRARLETRSKRLNATLDQLAEFGFTHFLTIQGDSGFSGLETKPLTKLSPK
ncbi:MAG: histidine--tRNA ligase [Actinomycetota bacterium]